MGVGGIVAALGLVAAAATTSGPTRWDRQQVTSRLTNLSGISSSSSDHVFAVGTRGTMLHFDGGRWSEQESGASKT